MFILIHMEQNNKHQAGNNFNKFLVLSNFVTLELTTLAPSTSSLMWSHITHTQLRSKPSKGKKSL